MYLCSFVVQFALSLFFSNSKPASDPLTVFHYIHQHPWRAGLVSKIEQWRFSSFPDYIGLRNGSMVNKILAADLLDLKNINLPDEVYNRIPNAVLRRFDKWGPKCLGGPGPNVVSHPS